MNVKDLSSNGSTSKKRMDVTSTSPTGGISNVSQADNSPVNMNMPEYKERGSRADDLIEMAGMDGYTLHTEAPRLGKMKG